METLEEKTGKIRKVLKLWDKIIKRLPSTYPKASIVLHMTEQELKDYYFIFYECSPQEESPPYAFCDLNSQTIHIHTMKELTAKEICWFLLHEEGHLVALKKFGKKDPRADDKDGKIDEAFANRFASDWVRRLDKEDWFL